MNEHVPFWGKATLMLGNMIHSVGTMNALLSVVWPCLVRSQLNSHFLPPSHIHCCTQDTALRYVFDAFQKALMMIPDP